MMSDKKEELCLVFKVTSKPSLHREVVLKPQRYREWCNSFVVAEYFPMEQTYH